MKLTKTQQKKLHRKLKTNASAENAFVSMFMRDFSNAVSKRIEKATSIEEVDAIIESIDLKKLDKYIRNLSGKVLRKNNAGFENVINSLIGGVGQLQKLNKERKAFSVAVPKLIKEKRIYEPLMQKFEYNMSLIKDLPKTVYKELRDGYLEGKSFRGTDLEQKLYERLGSRAKLIVRTESAKVNTALTEVRARSVGVNAYVWSTSDDQRVRKSHKLLNNVMFFWGDPPRFIDITKKGIQHINTCNCGEIYNCRCVALPVFELDDIQFPISVGQNVVITNRYVGKDKYDVTVSGITRYTRTQFLQKFGNIFGVTNDSLYIQNNK